ncbi:protein ALP1-like [Teleopsis dalmanni]|uniref:protein ALP1-like n=1 Tax=Teleopsis dalmanni TaxID=139649 RepID=UPI0018CD6F0E|nr:protein ALP1-like [Teleopsis dalmanni]XP_037954102.1 protein ALP1-like [Teleopsis dalmanni]
MVSKELNVDQKYQHYRNKKGWPSIVMQAVVDNNYLFRDVSVKLPGSYHNVDVFKESGLYKYSTQVIPTYTTDINGLPIPLMIIGDVTYPLLSWLIKPYTDCLNPEEESFNYHIRLGKIFVENVFGRLKGRWRCLLKTMDIDPEFVPFVALACLILHNFVERKNERFLDTWSLDMQNEIEFPQPQDDICNEIIVEENTDPKQ